MQDDLKQANSPMVSVLMTAFNREDFIAEAIESVLASTYTDFELIICDDCSVDDTVAIANKYAAADSRVKVFVNEKNIGQFQNRNKAASYATGKYLKYLDSDDKILDFGLAYCVDAMEQFPEAGLGMYDITQPQLKTVYCTPVNQTVHHHFFVKEQLSVGPTGTIIHRKKFLDLGGFDPRFGVPSDMFFNIRFAASFSLVFLPQMFVYYRRHDGQEINNQMDYLKFGYLYLKELLLHEKLPLQKKEINYLYGKMQKRHTVNVLKYFNKTKSITVTLKLMKDTSFSFFEMATSIFK